MVCLGICPCGVVALRQMLPGSHEHVVMAEFLDRVEDRGQSITNIAVHFSSSWYIEAGYFGHWTLHKASRRSDL